MWLIAIFMGSNHMLPANRDMDMALICKVGHKKIGLTHTRNGELVKTKEWVATDFPSSGNLLSHLANSYGESHLGIAVTGWRDADSVLMDREHWAFNEAKIKEKYGFDHVTVVTDVEALGRSQLPVKDATMILRVGTRLGAAFIRGDNDITPLDVGCLNSYALSEVFKKHGIEPVDPHRLRWDMFLCGGGLIDIYAQFLKLKERPVIPTVTKEVFARAKEGDEEARKALKLFWDVFGLLCAELSVCLCEVEQVLISGSVVTENAEAFWDSDFRIKVAERRNQLKRNPALRVSLIDQEDPEREGLRKAFGRV